MSPSLFVAYMTGRSGSSMGLFYIGDGRVAGIDLGGMKYDGVYKLEDKGKYGGILSYEIPPNLALVTGQTFQSGQKFEAPFELPEDFWNGCVVRIDTPTGPVNVRLEKIREI